MGTAPAVLIAAWMYWIALPLAALGLWFLYAGLWRDRAKGRRRCPRCWYDMSGATTLPARCPECGRTAATERDLHRTRRRWLLVALGLLLLAPLGVVFGKLHSAAVYYAVMPKWKLHQEERIEDTVVRFYRIRNPDGFGERVVVRSGGKIILELEDSRVGAAPPGFPPPATIFGDLNGDGLQEALINCHSGGAHCCTRAFIVEARPEGGAVVADIDTHGAVWRETGFATGESLIGVTDHSFEYWKAPYSESPKPTVYYRLQAGALRVALDRMDNEMNAAEAEMLARESALVTKDMHSGRPDPRLWRTMLDLIFAGHEPLAWVFFDRHWPGTAEEKETFRKEFLQVLGTDLWYQDLIAARAARDAGKPIPPSKVGMSGQALGKP